MPTPRLRRAGSASRPLVFLKGFLRNPKEVGSVIPSSRFLIRRVLDRGHVSRARVIVELGPGTGAVTREILRRMPADARLFVVEINPAFVGVLRRELRDPRLTVFEGRSTDLERALRAADVITADLVVSGVPFSTMERGEGRQTLEAAKRILGPGGRFVAYQFRDRVRRLAEPLFGPAETHQGFWNLPPMRIYVWRAAPEAP
jgi:phosphatidylethanolamine/phosphatidyl-N-methylethanolamine N-methyltransferase